VYACIRVHVCVHWCAREKRLRIVSVSVSLSRRHGQRQYTHAAQVKALHPCLGHSYQVYQVEVQQFRRRGGGGEANFGLNLCR
jgi:phage-related protein